MNNAHRGHLPPYTPPADAAVIDELHLVDDIDLLEGAVGLLALAAQQLEESVALRYEAQGSRTTLYASAPDGGGVDMEHLARYLMDLAAPIIELHIAREGTLGRLESALGLMSLVARLRGASDAARAARRNTAADDTWALAGRCQTAAERIIRHQTAIGERDAGIHPARSERRGVQPPAGGPRHLMDRVGEASGEREDGDE